ncbi:oligosaccharide flippase family protein [Gracilimonas mengyeensis]|uniref:Membrane protein involved in the export of O-antigen and teichoic acid n=1 Tax=Gracilimonas mengyeensis TaxID=1302730 RepID=A0A521DHW3_9BACT|nr:oligosaccharide flippase family protein [Gracilimonas mengyeensis]SMO70510.1 Membrane protein involved in the export of O-antigen and teichoic acid [Gracilimonas mengyeensis]
MEDKEKLRYKNLTSNATLARNTVIDIGSKIVPLLVGLYSIPILIEVLTEQGFGILALVWLIISYFSVFDMGLGPAVTKRLSEKIGEEKYEDIGKTAWTGIISSVFLGLAAAVILYLFSDILVISLFKVSEDFQTQAIVAFQYTAYALPFITSSSCFKSILNTLQRFDITSTLQSINSFFNYLLPLLVVSYIANDLSYVVMALLGLKVILFFVYLFFSLRIEKELVRGIKYDFQEFKDLLHFGKWITLSNAIGPFMDQMDRYFIASFISMSAVTFYTTPMDILSKVLILPMSFVSVLFPAFSSLATSNSTTKDRLLLQSLSLVMISLFPALLMISFFAEEGLTLWLGNASSDFITQSATVAHVFCITFFIRGIAYIPSIYLQGINRPDLTAKFHMAEIIIGAAIFYFAGQSGEILYVAYAGLGVTVLDFLLLIYATLKLQSHFQKELFRKVALILPLALILLIPMLSLSLLYEMLLLGILLLLFAIVSWKWLLDEYMISKIRSVIGN